MKSVFSFLTPVRVVGLIDRLQPLPRRLFLASLDAVLLPLSVWLSFWLRLAHPFHTSFKSAGNWLLISVLLIGLPLYAFAGQYQGLTRYVGSSSLYRLAARNFLLVLLLVVTGVMLRFPMPPRSSWILLWLILTGLTGAVRFVFRDILISLRSVTHKQLVRVAIYGAGKAGAQLAAALRLAGNYQIIAFIDDSPTLWDRTINGIRINPPQILTQIHDQLDQLLLAIPSLARSERRRIVADLQRKDIPVLQIPSRRRIVADLQRKDIPVLQIPSVDDITSGRARIDALRPVSIEDLLGRDPVLPASDLLGSDLRNAVVLVTGAGGSIGSELCSQILQLSPKTLILLESSEPSLYAIEQKLSNQLSSVNLIAVLGSATDFALVQRLFVSHCVQTVFHAAAYKHVPLVEANPLVGLANNVGSTRVVCQAALDSGVTKVILISTDKAVRPANVMGASKRVAELVLQACAQQSTTTCFAMVRFGNVLGSSGSVVPLFRRQIAAGGPITLTHPEIIRYFMTIREAAQLVLQASSSAEGGEVFLLDMGEPVRIKDLAEQMVRLSGLSLRDARNPMGDIEIICTGLRPGEKLYEELLIDAESKPTTHPLIYRAEEQFVLADELWPKLDALDLAIQGQDVVSALSLLNDLVPEWQREVSS